MSLSGTTTKATNLVGLRTIVRAANWTELPEAMSSQAVFGAYPLGTENYAYEAQRVIIGSLSIPWVDGGYMGVSEATDGVYAVTLGNRVIKANSGCFAFRELAIVGMSYTYDIYATASKVCAGGQSATSYGRIFESADGVSWSQVAASSNASSIFAFVPFLSAVFAIGTCKGSAKSEIWTDGSGTWTAVATPFASAVSVYSAAVHGSQLFVGGASGNVGRSSDGTTWDVSTPFTAMSGSLVVKALCSFGAHVYASVYASPSGDSAIWRTTDGTTWEVARTLTASHQVRSMTASESRLYGFRLVGTANYLDMSLDGTTWYASVAPTVSWTSGSFSPKFVNGVGLIGSSLGLYTVREA